MAKNPKKGEWVTITAGAPGAGKTRLLHQIMIEDSKQNKSDAYLDPDDVCLQKQEKTYQQDRKVIGQVVAYNKWRPASNAIMHLLLGNFIRDGISFYFGTTASSDKTAIFFDFLKKHNCKIKLIHVTAPDDVRWESIKERDKDFVQTTQEDIKEKGKLIHQRIEDTFLKFADVIQFYYREDAKQDAEIAAVWIRRPDDPVKMGALTIVSTEKYQKIKDIHNAAVKAELSWENTVENKCIKIGY